MITFHEWVTSLDRPFPDPYIEWHIGLYDAVTVLKQQLDSWTHRPLLSDRHLLELGVVHGAELIIDEENPIDFEPRYFSPDTPGAAAQRTRNWNRVEKWPILDPHGQDLIENWRGFPIRINIPLEDDVGGNFDRCLDMVDWGDWDGGDRMERSNQPEDLCWTSFLPPARTSLFRYNQIQIHQNYYHRLMIYDWSLWTPAGCSDNYADPEVPHSLVIVSDTITPPDNRLLRSEVLFAAMVLRESLAQMIWQKHYTLPMLMLSFSKTGCRILHIHFENARLHIRVSRSLNLVSSDGTVPPDGQLVVRWLMAQPIGETRFSNLT
ncbi:hypothetical protein GGI43DRAFT_117665 [Trichoderma evansii]